MASLTPGNNANAKTKDDIETKGKSVDELPPELSRAELSKFVNKDNGGCVDFEAFSWWYQEHSFKEYVNLSNDDIHVRDFGYALGLTSAEIEKYKQLFDKYDADRSGKLDMDEFYHVIKDLTKTPKDLDLPASRIKHFWDECDLDGNGTIDFEEFVIFYVKHFDPEAEEPMSDFYRGVRRM